MFSAKEKVQWVHDIQEGKPFTKKGKESNPFIGRLVKVDWDFQTKNMDMLGGIESLEDLSSPRTRKYIQEQEVFIITDVRNFGMQSTVTLDHLFSVSGYRVYDPKTQEYVFVWSDINGDGSYPYRPMQA